MDLPLRGEPVADEASERGFYELAISVAKAHLKQRPYETGEGSCEDVLS
jgi:hypothetical protein